MEPVRLVEGMETRSGILEEGSPRTIEGNAMVPAALWWSSKKIEAPASQVDNSQRGKRRTKSEMATLQTHVEHENSDWDETNKLDILRAVSSWIYADK